MILRVGLFSVATAGILGIAGLGFAADPGPHGLTPARWTSGELTIEGRVDKAGKPRVWQVVRGAEDRRRDAEAFALLADGAQRDRTRLRGAAQPLARDSAKVAAAGDLAYRLVEAAEPLRTERSHEPTRLGRALLLARSPTLADPGPDGVSTPVVLRLASARPLLPGESEPRLRWRLVPGTPATRSREGPIAWPEPVSEARVDVSGLAEGRVTLEVAVADAPDGVQVLAMPMWLLRDARFRLAALRTASQSASWRLSPALVDLARAAPETLGEPLTAFAGDRLALVAEAEAALSAAKVPQRFAAVSSSAGKKRPILAELCPRGPAPPRGGHVVLVFIDGTSTETALAEHALPRLCAAISARSATGAILRSPELLYTLSMPELLDRIAPGGQRRCAHAIVPFGSAALGTGVRENIVPGLAGTLYLGPLPPGVRPGSKSGLVVLDGEHDTPVNRGRIEALVKERATAEAGPLVRVTRPGLDPVLAALLEPEAGVQALFERAPCKVIE